MNNFKSIALILACIGVTAASAEVPQPVVRVAKEMQSDGVEVRAGFSKGLGVFVVASGSARISGTKAGAKEGARADAKLKIATFMGAQISSKTRSEVSESSVNGRAEIKEFFSSVTEVDVKQLLKGVQDLSSDDDGETVTVVVYLTTKAQDKTAELNAAVNAMGDEGTVCAVGEAKTHQHAVQMALRAAVEQVVGTMVVGEIKISDNVTVRNKIFAGAEGFVDTYRVTEEVEVSLGWRVTVVAKVSKKRILDSYRVHLKALGDPLFYLNCTSSDSDLEDKQIAARFGQFFRKLGFRITTVSAEADFCINAFGEYRRVKNPMDEDQTYTQYSVTIKVLSKSGEELLSIPNNPRKSAVCINNPERERELCAEKAFKQMEKPVHEAINAMISRMMAEHNEKILNSENK